MALDHVPPAEAGEKNRVFKINGRTISVGGGGLDGRQALEKGGFDPANDHVLVRLTRPGSRAIGLEEEIVFEESEVPELRAFLFDRTLNCTVAEHGYAWGAPHISEIELRNIAMVEPDEVLLLEREDEPDLVIEEGGLVDLGALGTEHLRVEKRFVTVFYKEEPLKLARGIYTGAQLAERLKVPTNYILDLVTPTGDFKEIGLNDKVRVRNGMEFVSHPPKGQSS